MKSNCETPGCIYDAENHGLCRQCWHRIPIKLRRNVWWHYKKWRRYGLVFYRARYESALEDALRAMEQS